MAEPIDPELLQQLITLNPDEVIVPLRMKREDVSKIKAVKLTDEEVILVKDFQEYLKDRRYIPQNNFASLFVYLFNLAFTLHKPIADAEAEKEEKET